MSLTPGAARGRASRALARCREQSLGKIRWVKTQWTSNNPTGIYLMDVYIYIYIYMIIIYIHTINIGYIYHMDDLMDNNINIGYIKSDWEINIIRSVNYEMSMG